jgi:hypothetical protein
LDDQSDVPTEADPGVPDLLRQLREALRDERLRARDEEPAEQRVGEPAAGGETHGFARPFRNVRIRPRPALGYY